MADPYRKTSTAGIRVRHQKGCPAADDPVNRCARSCSPTWQATAGRGVKPKVFKERAAAVAWRADRLAGRAEETEPNPPAVRAISTTVADLVAAWEREVEAGKVLNRSGQTFKPRARKNILSMLRVHVIPVVGHVLAEALTEDEMQDLIDGLQMVRAPQTVRNAVYALSTVYNWARRTRRVPRHCKPTLDLWLPAKNEKPRDRVETPKTAALLIEALEHDDRAGWALAFWAGLRSSELRASTWSDVDVDAGTLRVKAALTGGTAEGPHRPKSRAGVRGIPMISPLRRFLREEYLRQGRPALDVLICPGPRGGAMSADALTNRCRRQWTAAGLDTDGDDPLGLHNARHTYASIVVRAGVDVRSLQEYLGHSSIVTTQRYLHRLQGASSEDAKRIDAYLRDQGC